ncbi:MAG: chloramphenicol acetyltransferase [Eubacteriales bacterium]|nr:chloramphenicol acetyltransferase [Eubacteriales bacterium]
MPFHYLNMETYPRKSHFDYFSSLAYPYVGLTVNVDITALLDKIRADGLPFFLTVCYCAAQAANAVPELRQRIVDGKIVEFDSCPISHTLALADGTYCYCTLETDLPFGQFLTRARLAQERAKTAGTLDEEDPLDKLFVSTLPWVSYTAIVQPVPMPADSNPRITWGKYFAQEGKILLPVSVLCHHALVDGRHLGEFYRHLEAAAASLTKE